jgi:hypothetical protein
MFKSRSDIHRLPFDRSDQPMVRSLPDIWFERLYLVLAVFGEAALLPGMLHPHAWAGGEGVHLTAEAIVFIMLFPVFATPYWMALAITRARSKVAKYYLYAFVFVLDFVVLGEIVKSGFSLKSVGFLLSGLLATLGLASLQRVPLISRWFIRA